MFLLTTVIGSAGFVLAIMSFITGLQILRGNTAKQLLRGSTGTAKKMHRLNGLLTFIVFVVLALIMVIGGYSNSWLNVSWLCGLFFGFLKMLVVRKKTAYKKFASQLGFVLVIIWIVVIINIF